MGRIKPASPQPGIIAQSFEARVAECQVRNDNNAELMLGHHPDGLTEADYGWYLDANCELPSRLAMSAARSAVKRFIHASLNGEGIKRIDIGGTSNTVISRAAHEAYLADAKARGTECSVPISSCLIVEFILANSGPLVATPALGSEPV